MNDIELAKKLAKEAGRILIELRETGQYEGKSLGNAGDAAANDYLMAEIKRQRPDDGILSEETKDTPERLSKSRVWIIDPVDGTREYSEGRDDWAVHIALSVDGKPAIGAVALPDLGLVLASDDDIITPKAANPLRMVVSRSRPAKEAVAIAEKLGAQLISMGSAGAKAMALVRGAADIYAHSGGQYEWDNCAPAAVAMAAGFHCSRIDGTPLHYNQKDTYLPDLLFCHKENAQQILDIINEIK